MTQQELFSKLQDEFVGFVGARPNLLTTPTVSFLLWKLAELQEMVYNGEEKTTGSSGIQSESNSGIGSNQGDSESSK